MLQSIKNHLTDLLLPEAQRASELERALRAARTAHIAARRALALTEAEEDREVERRDAMVAEAGSLQTHAIEALEGGRDDLASRAADAIAVLETEVAASQAASIRFAAKVAATRRTVDAERRRLADLDRGRRLARVGAALNGSALSADGLHPLARAEAALAAVEASNADADAVRLAFAPAAQTIADDLADAGFGRPGRVSAADVMTRLRALAAPAACLPKA